MVRFFCIVLLSFCICVHNLSYGQLSSCVNADFEQNSFLNWVGSTGSCCPISMFANGIITGRHTIMSGPGFDPNSNNQIPVVAPGGTYSARLGNDDINSEAEQLRYSFTVSAQTELFIYRYAVILEDPVHDPADQPRFEIRVFDQNNNAVGCGTYNVVSGAGIPGFQTWLNPTTGDDIHFQTWQTVGIELSSYMGQTVTIEFSTGDCSLGGHFGYAYVDAYCSPLRVSSDYCPGSNFATLVAPTGFASYLWSNGATTQSITVSNPVVGAQYDVTMTSVTGCQVTLTQVITITNIIAHYTATPTCQNGTVFNDSSYVLSGSQVTNWNWNFGDGNTSTLQNPSHSFTAPGNYNVQLIASNAGGCVDTVVKAITIKPAPVADFTFTPDCPGSPVVFTNQSTFAQGNITGQSWNFGDATPPNAGVNTSHTYAGVGPYTASLIIQGDNGCTDTATYAVQTKNAPVALFNFAVQCLSNTVTFTDASTLTGGIIASWKWDFGDGSPKNNTQNPIHLYAGNGPFDVKLIVTGSNGCTDTITKSVAMATFPTSAFSTGNECKGQLTQFTDMSVLTGGAITSWKWYFDDGGTSLLQNPLHTYASSGNYTVSLAIVANNGCGDSIAIPVVVKNAPVADFNSASVCPGQPSTFTGTTSFPGGTLNAWEWDFGDGTGVASTANSSYTYATAGTYNVMYVAIGTNGCRDTVVKPITTSVTPTARFAAPGGCANTPLLFSSSSIIASGSITGWAWNFGDATPVVNLQSTNHSFSHSGSFNVSLTVTSNNGCTNTITHEVSVSDKPVPNFVSNLGCEMDSTHLINTSTTANGTINYVKWLFGDGGTLTGTDDLYHHYTDSGYYNVTLIVSNSIGCSDTIDKNVYVKAKPDPGFIWGNICEGAPATFNDTSVLANGTITAWQWDFNGNAAWQQQASHTFASAGTEAVSLTVTGNNNCKATVTKTVTVHPKPATQFTSGTGCVNSAIGFTNQSTIPSGSIDSAFWNFGDTGATTYGHNGIHTYTTDGNFNVTLITQSDFGCRDTSIDTVKIYPLPVANFTAAAVCLNQTTVFNDISDPVADSLIMWRWYFDDGTSTASPTPTHVYTADSTYNVMLVVWNNGGCRDTIIRPVIVKALPQVGFTNSNPCVYGAVSFQDTSLLPGYQINSWQWSFDDSAATASTAAASHTFNQFGQYNITLTVSASNGCVDSIVQPLIVNRLPLSSFAANNICEGNALTVNDQSQLVGGTITSWLWNWGDTTSDTIAAPTHLYATDGTYPVYLKVTGSNGCINDTTLSIRIYDKPLAYFSNNNPCQLAPVNFADLSTVQNDTLATWYWNFDDGSFSSVQNESHAFALSQPYDVELIVTSGFGCKDTIMRTVTVAPKPNATFAAQNVCFQNPMQFQDNSFVATGSINTWRWDFGDANTSGDINPSHVYASTGNKTIALIVQTDHNCYDTTVAQYRVYELPVSLFTADTMEGCQPFFVDLDDHSTTAEGTLKKWVWDFGDGTTDTITNPDVRVYDEPGYFDVTLLVETDLGCKDTLVMDNYIHVFPKPMAAFTTEPSATSILHAVIDFKDQSYGASQWLYDFADSTTSVEQNPTHWFPQPADYFVTQYAISMDGCVDTTFRYIEIKNDFAFYIPNSFTPNSDSKNDVFKAYGIGVTDYSMQIFNRWGQLIFTSANMEDGWDGSFKNEKVKQGTYVYAVKVRDIFNKPHTYQGSVTVVR